MTNGENETLCFYCHKNIRPEIRFCPHCGKKQPQLDSSHSNKDPYEILQVSQEAEKEVIDAAYKGLARKYHPDTNSSVDASAKMQDINWAYEILGNKSSRYKWDQVHSPEKLKSQQAKQEMFRENELRQQKVHEEAEQRKNEQAEVERRRVAEELSQQKARAEAEQRKQEEVEANRRRVEEDQKQQKARDEAYQHIQDLEDELRRVDEDFKRKYGNPDHFKNSYHEESWSNPRTESLDPHGTARTKTNTKPKKTSQSEFFFRTIVAIFGIVLFLIVIITITNKFSSSDSATIHPNPTISNVQPIVNNKSPESGLGKVVFSDNFSDTSSGWAQFTDSDVNMEYKNGKYQITVNKIDWMVWANYLNQDFSDSIIDVTVNIVKSTDEGTFGIICRNYEDNFYSFLLNEKGMFAIYKNKNNGFIVLKDWNQARSFDIYSNKITVSCIGEQLSLSINGVEEALVFDKDFSKGAISLFAATGKIPDFKVSYDDLTVKSPPTSNPPEFKGETKIAILAPLSGPVPAFGISTKEGALLAIKEWNDKGGVLGNKIIPILEDSQCTPDPAVNAANKVINQDLVKYIVGEVCSSASIPVSVLANERKVVQISPTSTNPNVVLDSNGIVKPFTFVACYNDKTQGKVMAKFAKESLNAKTAYIMFDPSNDYVRGLGEYFEKYFIEKGGKIVGKGTYKGNDTDFTKILIHIAKLKPDVVVLPDYYNVVNLITNQAKEKGIKAPFIGGDGWDSPDLDPKAADGSFFSNHFSPSDNRSIVKNFVKHYGETYKDEIGLPKTPDTLAALAYDATNIMIKGIQMAGDEDTKKVALAISAGNFDAVTGQITFNQFHNPIKPVGIISVKGGEQVFDSSLFP